MAVAERRGQVAESGPGVVRELPQERNCGAALDAGMPALGAVVGGRGAPTGTAAMAVVRWADAAWRYLREVSGDDAYERYLAHHSAHHAGEPPMSPKQYFCERQRQKWSGVSRCC